MSPIVREHYHVPRRDHETYIWPATAHLPDLVNRNRQLAASWGFEFAGRPCREFRTEARAEIMALARRYAERWDFTVEREWEEPAPIIVTGHQPPPFHPGVWIKNFLAGSLAEAVGGVALNLAVDNDEARGQAFRFPAFAAQARLNGDGPVAALEDLEEVRVVEAAFASGAGGAAFEEQPATAFRPESVHEVLGLLPPALAEAFRRCTAALISAIGDASSLAEAFFASRRRLEETVGLRNLELPVSCLADSEAFRLFVAEMLRRHEELFAAYNDSLAEYRRVYRERSRAQPMPDLARDGPRVELPFWVWRAGERRRRLWVESGKGDVLTLSADRETIGGFLRSIQGEGGWRQAAGQLADLRRAGWKIRPRALAMTLFARLAVGDTFVHGLGGALYDKIADGLFERLFRVRAPEIVLASCTVFPPLDTYPATLRDRDAARRAVRQWRFNPDRMLSEAARGRREARMLIEEKRRLIRDRRPTAEGRRRAFLRIHEINAALAALEPDGPPAAQRQLESVEQELRWNAILRNREYPFCFHNAENLAAFYREATLP